MSKIVEIKIVSCPICGSKISSYKNIGTYFCRHCRNNILVYNLDDYTDQEIEIIHNMFEKTRLTLEENGLNIDEVELMEMTLDVFEKERFYNEK